MRQILWGAFVIAAGCTGASPEDGAGGKGAQELDTSDGTIDRLAGATDERPCADHTVANVELPNGNRMAFCVFGDGHEMFHESGRLGHAAFFGPNTARPSCGLDLYLAGTPEEVPVPAALVNACPSEHRIAALSARKIVDDAVFQPVKQLGSIPRTNYCAVPDTTFESERCFHCSPYDDCIDWCVRDHWGWHDRWMSASNMLGEEGNIAIETNSSCGGNTRVRQWERDDAGDAWGSPDADYNVASGHWANSGFIWHSVVIFGQDYDFRLRADSVSGAYHQHSGYFLDE